MWFGLLLSIKNIFFKQKDDSIHMFNYTSLIPGGLTLKCKLLLRPSVTSFVCPELKESVPIEVTLANIPVVEKHGENFAS